MALTGEYIPSTSGWVREQIETYEASGGTEAGTLRETGIPVIIVTFRGKGEGTIRKIALMRVEHDGEYALIASMGGAPKNPAWYHSLVRNPNDVTIQDGPEPFAVTRPPRRGRRAPNLVGPWRCGVPDLRRVRSQDRSNHPDLRRHSRLSSQISRRIRYF